MKTAVSSYSFTPLISDGTLNQLSCVAAAKDLGFEGIEFTELQPHDGSTPLEYAKKIARECSNLGIPVVNYAVGADFIHGSNGFLQDEIQKVKDQVDIAHALGSPCLRHDISRGYDINGPDIEEFQKVLPKLAKACKEITRYAAAKNIKTTTENHGFFSQDSVRVKMLMDAVSHPNFGWLCDVGNFLCVDENPLDAVIRAAPYAFHVHAKDFHFVDGSNPHPGNSYFETRGGNYLRGAIVGQGVVDVRRCLQILKNAGYDGYVSIEFEGIEPTMDALSNGLSNLNSFLPKA